MSFDFAQVIADHRDLLDQANDKILSDEYQPVTDVYVDICCVKDLRLGLLLGLSTKDRSAYITSGIERYNRRPLRNFLFAYPEFPYTEEQLQKMYFDAKYQRIAFNHAPDTILAYKFTQLNAIFQGINARAGNEDTVVNVTINCYPLGIGKLLHAYCQILNIVHQATNLRFQLISVNPLSIPASSWAKYQFQFLDNIADLHQENTGWTKACYIDKSLQHANIFAALSLDQEHFKAWDKNLDWNDQEQIADRFQLTELILSVMTHFKFVIFNIPNNRAEVN